MFELWEDDGDGMQWEKLAGKGGTLVGKMLRSGQSEVCRGLWPTRAMLGSQLSSAHIVVGESGQKGRAELWGGS